MPFFFDESIHERGGFVLGAYVYGPDPTIAVDAALRAAGLHPGKDEFKSSSKMSEHPEQQILRTELRRVLGWDYSYAVVVVPASERHSLGREALLGLDKVCRANGLHAMPQAAFRVLGKRQVSLFQRRPSRQGRIQRGHGG